MEKSRAKVNTYQNEINYREREIKKLGLIVEDKENVVTQTAVDNDRMHRQVKSKDAQIADNNREIEALKTRVQGQEAEIDALKQRQRSEGTVFLELEHFKADNERLIKLLNSTPEYKEFSDFAQDNRGSVRFLAGKKPYGKSECPDPEDESWIPREAFDIAHGYRTQHPEGLSETLINKMLRELNQIWRDRERRMIARVKLTCATEIKDLRRQITHRAPVSEKDQAKTIERLRNQLKEAKRDLRNNVAKRKDDKNRPGVTDHIEDALKVAEGFQNDQRKLFEKNKLLSQRNQDLEKLVKNEEADRAKFMEGAAWMSRKAVADTIGTQKHLKSLMEDFSSKRRAAELSGRDVFVVQDAKALTSAIEDCLEAAKRSMEGYTETSTAN